MKVVGFGLPSSALVVAGSFLVCFELPLQVCSLVFVVAPVWFVPSLWFAQLVFLGSGKYVAVRFRCSLNSGGFWSCWLRVANTLRWQIWLLSGGASRPLL